MFTTWFKLWQHKPTINVPIAAARTSQAQLIELRQVIKQYETDAGLYTALKGIDLAIDAGEFVAIVGKSGSGKSTLLNMLTGIDRPTTGQVVIGGVALHQLSESQIALWRGRNLGVIFQFFQLLPTLTLVENVMLPMDFCNLYTPTERRERAMHLLGQVEMTEQAQKMPAAVSGGQQQRVAIARALANDPPIIVADEPTGSLDSRTADAIFALFAGLVAQGKTFIMVTHDNDLAARAARTVVIADGAVVTNERRVHESITPLIIHPIEIAPPTGVKGNAETLWAPLYNT